MTPVITPTTIKDRNETVSVQYAVSKIEVKYKEHTSRPFSHHHHNDLHLFQHFSALNLHLPIYISITIRTQTHKYKFKMRSSAFVTIFSVLASLASAATYYRGDTRGPTALKADDGFKARGYTNPEGTLFEHVEGTLKKPMRDPFISTTSDEGYAKEHNGKGYVYSIE
jgi:hypothetical protein